MGDSVISKMKMITLPRAISSLFVIKRFQLLLWYIIRAKIKDSPREKQHQFSRRARLNVRGHVKPFSFNPPKWNKQDFDWSCRDLSFFFFVFKTYKSVKCAENWISTFSGVSSSHMTNAVGEVQEHFRPERSGPGRSLCFFSGDFPGVFSHGLTRKCFSRGAVWKSSG